MKKEKNAKKKKSKQGEMEHWQEVKKMKKKWLSKEEGNEKWKEGRKDGR